MESGPLKEFLLSKPFQRWGYFPIDASGPNGFVASDIAKSFQGFDRSLAYTRWAAGLIDKTLAPENPTEHLPHGLDGTVFRPMDRKEARETFVECVTGKSGFALKDDILMLGVVATNTPRKDWGLTFEVCGELLKRGQNIGLWAHCAISQGYWDLIELATMFGMKDRIVFSSERLSDESMAWCYSAMDVTLGIGSEGWGYPSAESLACGVPHITCNYASSPEIVPEEFLVDPVTFRMEGPGCSYRPVFKPADWAEKIIESKGKTAMLAAELYWENLWPRWQEWILKGLENV
jgi:glycosyltransferase involved in cell wall biosynthesis